jgi:hypothetical protein
MTRVRRAAVAVASGLRAITVQPLKQMPTIGKVVTAVAFVVLVLYMADSYRSWANAPVQDAIEHDLGFRIGTPYVDPEAPTFRDRLFGGREVITIERVVPGKPMAQAGVRSHDILIAPHYGDTRDLFDDLNRARGGTFAMTVERDGKRAEAVVAVPRRPTGVATQPVRGRSAQ